MAIWVWRGSVLAVGVVGWESFVHGALLGGGPSGTHLVRDVLLAIVPGTVAAWLVAGLLDEPASRGSVGRYAAALGGTFALLLIPSGVVHTLFDRALSASAMPGAGHVVSAESSASIAGLGTHAIRDAAIGLPAAIAAAAVAIVPGLRRRPALGVTTRARATALLAAFVVASLPWSGPASRVCIERGDRFVDPLQARTVHAAAAGHGEGGVPALLCAGEQGSPTLVGLDAALV